MTTLKFKCTLMSDIVLSQTSSTEGNQKTLDFIPGNCFLGIVAAQIYNKLGKGMALDIFHSGKVRFGDAHPSEDGIRGLKVPASMYYPKLEKASEKCYIHHQTDHGSDKIKGLQLKQCREGFYVFKKDEHKGQRVETLKDFTIKSAYDSDKRRSEDGKMFGYESLSKGMVMCFEIESELSDDVNSKIVKALEGKRQIGHSRSAEFGLVQIEQDNSFNEVPSVQTTSNEITVYADGRLIFLDENGEPTFQPSAGQLLRLNKEEMAKTEAKILWEKSQIRTFQYSPWNSKRHTYDTDRCGIEKGSVFVIALNGTACLSESQYVGAYQNEGFGKVVYNPDFLMADEAGVAQYTLTENADNKKALPKKSFGESLNPRLMQLLGKVKDTEKAKSDVYSIVADTNELRSRFGIGESFASQWSSIRSLAMTMSDADKLIKAIDNFLDHGVAQAKWGEQQRKKLLDDFMDLHKDKPNFDEIMINLASEMAKKCSPKRKEEKK